VIISTAYYDFQNRSNIQSAAHNQQKTDVIILDFFDIIARDAILAFCSFTNKTVTMDNMEMLKLSGVAKHPFVVK
jgi:hypothetical protein